MLRILELNVNMPGQYKVSIPVKINLSNSYKSSKKELLNPLFQSMSLKCNSNKTRFNL